MLTVKRYLNGVPIERSELKNIVIDSSLIRHIIADVNRRLKFLSGQDIGGGELTETSNKVAYGA